MCTCCKGLCTWCKAFTKLEICLTCGEVVLVAVFAPLLVLLVLHLVACARPPPPEPPAPPPACTWQPGRPTPATTLYYLQEEDSTQTTAAVSITDYSEDEYVVVPDVHPQTTAPAADPTEEEPSDRVKAITLALVKPRPPRGVTFGCSLTVVGRFWALTTASCVEAVEEADSLDSYTMLEWYGERAGGRAHAVAELRVHPLYREHNRSYDAAALRSADSLLRGGLRPARLALALHHAALVPGERVLALVYGAVRGAGGSPGLHAAVLHVLAARACTGGSGALRHLWAGRRAGGAACGGAGGERCVGALDAAPCNVCGGGALVSGGRVVGLAPRDAPCGEACDPFVFGAGSRLRAWLSSFVRSA